MAEAGKREKILHVVSVEPSDDAATLFIRDGASIRKMALPYTPYVLLSSSVLLNGMNAHFDVVPLAGEGAFKYAAVFKSRSDYEDAKKFLRSVTGFSAGSPAAPYEASSDGVHMFLALNGIRLFEGMDFEDLVRLQLDIETLHDERYDFPNADRETDKIAIISLSDSTGREKVLSLRNYSGGEKELLEDFVKVLSEWDPDVIEGHNVFRFDLPYIERRAKMMKVKLSIGRDGSAPKKRSSRFSAAERTVNYTRYDVYGRYVVDTYHLVLAYDAIYRALDGLGLKTAAKHFGVAAPDRVYADASKMNALYRDAPETAEAYCLDDVRETRALSSILSPSYFYQTQILPFSYQNVMVRGTATKIDGLFHAEYLTNRQALPAPERGRPFEGALTASLAEGVFHDVMHCDVRSLYPSVILSFGIEPKRDALHVFSSWLGRLRKFRLEAKDAARKAEGREKRRLASIQSAFKILINSFYGYLGFEQGFLNDFDAAEEVTARGRKVLTSMLDYLKGRGANVIEIDTDGIYFQPPEGVSKEDLSDGMKKILPEGIEVDFDEEYKSMFSYRSKNYALLKSSGELTISGAALKSRGLEPFQRDYMRNIILALLNDDAEAIGKNDEYYFNAIRTHALPLAALAKSETLSDSVETYLKKQSLPGARRSAAYELAAASGREYRQGDPVYFYITGTKKRVPVVGNSKLLSDADPAVRDENVEYYLGKLEELKEKFSSFIPEKKEDDLFSF